MYRLFEIFNATTKRAIWKAKLAPGANVCIHTVTLDDPLLLKITLRYCKTVEGILINKAKVKKVSQHAFADKVNQYMEVSYYPTTVLYVAQSCSIYTMYMRGFIVVYT